MGKGQHNNNNGGGDKMKKKILMMKRGVKCSYGSMLLLGFGIAVFGAMFLHKLRERRVFDIIIKEKDEQLFSLNLLLEKEKDYIKEIQRKTEEMRAKIYSLRTQKMNLENTILEMRSTISSMKDEQRTLEMALEEKQNEINQLTKRQLEYIKLTPLTDTLSQKEAGTEGLKQHIDQQVKMWSVSADDPSNPKVNITEAGESKETAVEAVHQVYASRNESSSKIDEAESTENEEDNNKLERTSEERMTNETNTTDHSQRENSENSQVEGSSNVDGKEVNNLNGGGGYKSSVEVGKSRDSDEGKDGHLKMRESALETGNEKSGIKYKGGIKLQMADNEVLRVKNTYRRKGKGKKLGIAKHMSEENVVRIGGRRFGKREIEIERNRDGGNGDKKLLKAMMNPEVSAGSARSMSDKENTKTDAAEDVKEKEIEQIISEKHNIYSDVQQTNRTADGKGQPNEVQKEDYEERDSIKVRKSFHGKTSERDEVPENFETEDLREPDIVTSRESSSILKDGKEEYKEETNEPDI